MATGVAHVPAFAAPGKDSLSWRVEQIAVTLATTDLPGLQFMTATQGGPGLATVDTTEVRRDRGGVRETPQLARP